MESERPAGGTSANLVLMLALVAGLSFYASNWLGQIPEPALWAWKGAGVAVLAFWAALNARALDGWLIALVMAAGAAGDVLIDAVSLEAGAIAFLVGHLIAMLLYWRNIRPSPSSSQLILAIVLVPAVIWIAWSLPADRDAAPGVALYSAGLALMGALAWISRFPRYRTGIGAMLFVASDLLIFARIGPFEQSMLPGLLIWPLYFLGQAMIAVGVVGTLRAKPAD